jgi:hypothetical protein
VTEMRPDPDSDLAGEQSEYGDDTGFAAEATRVPGTDPDTGRDADRDDTAGLTAEDDHHPGDGAD